MSLFDEIAGYSEAVEREKATRDAAFVNLPREVCGKPVLPITLRRLLILDGVKSPFITNHTTPSGADVALFLWVCSPEFCADKSKRDKFIAGCRKLKYAQAVSEIGEMILETFYDSPARGKEEGERASYWSFAASVIDTIATEYGWYEEQILDAPLARVLQYVKIISHRKLAASGNPPPLFNPSDKVKHDWLVAQNNAAEAKAKNRGGADGE